jgi:protein ImuB
MLWLCIRLPQLPPEALARLAVWAQQWSSHVSSAPARQADDGPDSDFSTAADAVLWLEIGASLNLFGGHTALRAEVAATLAQLGHSGELAIAPTLQAARLLTQVHEPRTVLHREMLPARLATLPLKWLLLPAAVIAALRTAGFRQIGEVLALPAAALARRFGPGTSLYLQRLTGEASDPLPATPLPARFDSHCEFSAEVTDTTALLFPLQRLLWELQGYLRARDCALQRWRLRLTHYRHADTCLTLRCSQPSRDALQLLALAREQLAVTMLAAPVRMLHLEADEFTQPVVLQGDFFTRAAASAQQLQQVLDRLRARLGADSVQVARAFPDHRPERAWRMASLADDAAAALNHATDAARPCWLLPQPLSVNAPLEILAGPERIESGWWDDGDVARDYYLARSPDGARQWIFQDLRNHQWFLQGLWS